MLIAGILAEASSFRWLPREIDLGFAGTSALITATAALALVWPARLVLFVRRERRGQGQRSVSFETLATLSSGAAGLGALLGLAFTISGALFA
ncbi:MAG: hypothetical protein JWR63_1576 [Conexibacter sp.]|nr:hypothetical protein [Conexibacter sp.]